MARYVVRRIVQALLTLVGLTVAVFAVSRLSGDPASLLLSVYATPEDVHRFRDLLGLDAPLHEQYLLFLGNALRGNFGTSFQYHLPALPLVLERAPATLELATVSMVVAVVVGLPAGIVAATRRNSWVDVATSFFALLGQSAPGFWIGIVLITVFAVQLRVLPSSGYGTWQQLVLPSITLALYAAASIARLTRVSVLETLGQDYVRTARAKGLASRHVIGVHALRNAAIPIVTLIGLQYGALLAGAVIVEWIFAWPGVGRLAVQAVLTRDYPLMQAAVFVSAIGFLIINSSVDLLYHYLDPRLRLSATRG